MAQTCRVAASGAALRSTPIPSTAAAPKPSAKTHRYWRCHAGTLLSFKPFFQGFGPVSPGQGQYIPGTGGCEILHPWIFYHNPKKVQDETMKKYKVFAGNLCQFFEFQTNSLQGPEIAPAAREIPAIPPAIRRQWRQHAPWPAQYPFPPAGKFDPALGKELHQLFHLPGG